MRYRIRKKLNKFVVEKISQDKIESRTLDPRKVWNLLSCPDTEQADVSLPTKESISNAFEKGAQSSLTEPSEEDISKTLEEISK